MGMAENVKSELHDCMSFYEITQSAWPSTSVCLFKRKYTTTLVQKIWQVTLSVVWYQVLKLRLIVPRVWELETMTGCLDEIPDTSTTSKHIPRQTFVTIISHVICWYRIVSHLDF